MLLSIASSQLFFNRMADSQATIGPEHLSEDRVSLRVEENLSTLRKYGLNGISFSFCRPSPLNIFMLLSAASQESTTINPGQLKVVGYARK